MNDSMMPPDDYLSDADDPTLDDLTGKAPDDSLQESAFQGHRGDVPLHELDVSETDSGSTPTPDSPSWPWSTFDPQQPHTDIIGDPSHHMQYGQPQHYPDTSAVALQKALFDQLLPEHSFSEESLRQEAMENGWYVPGGGTPEACLGNLLAAHGFPNEPRFGASQQDLVDQLSQHQSVLVAINADEIRTTRRGPQAQGLADYPGLPGQGATCVVQVIGLDRSDPAHPMVILNDPSLPNGNGLLVPADEFLAAWDHSDRLMVSTTSQGPEPEVTRPSDIRFGALDLWGQPYYPSSGEYYDPAGQWEYP